MAKSPTPTTKGNTTVADDGKKKRRFSGERKAKPVYLVYTGDANVLMVSRDAFAILEQAKGDPNVKYLDISPYFKSAKKGSAPAVQAVA